MQRENLTSPYSNAQSAAPGTMIRTAACLLLALSVTTAAADINKSGAYVAGIGGYNQLADRSIEARIDGTSGAGEAAFSGSYLVGFAVGYRFNENWAVEEEVVFRRSTLDRANLSPIGDFSDGNFENTQLSAKALYHFPLRANNDIELYVGAGITWLSELDFDVETVNGEQPFEDDRFGFELHAGVRYFGWKHAFAGAGLRYLSVGDTNLPSPSNGENIVRTDYDPYSVVVELGWRF